MCPMPGSSHRADHPVNPWSSLLARFVPDRADPAPLHWVAVRSLTRTEAGWQTAQQSPPCLPELTCVGFAGVPVFELRSGLICIHQGRERERGGGQYDRQSILVLSSSSNVPALTRRQPKPFPFLLPRSPTEHSPHRRDSGHSHHRQRLAGACDLSPSLPSPSLHRVSGQAAAEPGRTGQRYQ